jgi:hypothetical protein
MRCLPLSLASPSSALLQSRPFGPLPPEAPQEGRSLVALRYGGACGAGCFQYADRVECQRRSRLAASHDASIGDPCGASARAFADRLFQVRRADLAPQFADRSAILPRRADAVGLGKNSNPISRLLLVSRHSLSPHAGRGSG